jgi:hypothetical protein
MQKLILNGLNDPFKIGYIKMKGLFLDGRRCDGKRAKNAWTRNELIRQAVKEGIKFSRVLKHLYHFHLL